MGDVRLQMAIEQIEFARGYTLELLKDIDDGDWFRMPGAGITHVAWQVGHLAMAQFFLAIARLRDERPEDEQLISASFRKHFGRDSTPEPDSAKNPTPAEIRAVLNRVHEQSLKELPGYATADLDTPPLKPHPLFTSKLGSLLWCARHELIHAGQIGLLRRELGKAPRW
jgi:hypothetical protein